MRAPKKISNVCPQKLGFEAVNCFFVQVLSAFGQSDVT